MFMAPLTMGLVRARLSQWVLRAVIQFLDNGYETTHIFFISSAQSNWVLAIVQCYMGLIPALRLVGWRPIVTQS